MLEEFEAVTVIAVCCGLGILYSLIGYFKKVMTKFYQKNIFLKRDLINQFLINLMMLIQTMFKSMDNYFQIIIFSIRQ